MLVHLKQYKPDEADDTVRSEGDVSPDRDSDDYFGEDDLDADEWERTTENGETYLQRSVSLNGVSALSIPEAAADEDVPGVTVQLRIDGEETYVDNAAIVEVQDSDP
jgi:hypothetical protein